MQPAALQRWHEAVKNRCLGELDALLASDAVFYSPVVYSPQRGKDLVKLYLAGALQVLGNETFRYVREVAQGNHAVLEFEARVEGIYVNGVDMLAWDERNQIVEIKVMLRPLKAIEVVRQRMAAMLEELQRQR
ncbi:MAG: hypothetical protein KatS3mg077_1510 [Candidatus Binatia bacterium]|nr:MAG: hypothetical protein KatS3mg015_2597 [Fimbriimonadales bacterium]GIW44228.1 MAG: hypothetical protein KatS3mg077_1510 [Candidatus Binatia bacterium]